MYIYIEGGAVVRRHNRVEVRESRTVRPAKREFCIDNLLVRIHFIIQMILVDRPCAMGI